MHNRWSRSHRGVGFGASTALAVVTLAPSAFAVGENLPAGSACATIVFLPFVDTGDTAGLDCNGDPITDDHDEVCPYSGSTSPEVFYTITPNELMDVFDGKIDGVARLNIVACQAAYDNKLYVYDESLETVACVDDACSNANGDALRSQIIDVGLDVGSTYYIAMDGWGGEAGQYELAVDTSAPGCLFCDPSEDEVNDIGQPPPPIGNNTCETTTDAIACNQSFCGSSNQWNANPPCESDADCGGEPGSCDLVTGTCSETALYRDLDFIRLTVPVDTDTLTVRMVAEFTLELFMLREDPDCDGLTEIFAVQGVGWCVGTNVTLDDVPAGEYVLIATEALSGGPIGPSPDRGYELFVECSLDCPADLDGNGVVGFNDLTTLLAGWGACRTVN